MSVIELQFFPEPRDIFPAVHPSDQKGSSETIPIEIAPEVREMQKFEI
jgi:hypothetical protein